MARHNITSELTPHGWVAICSCRMRGPFKPSRSVAEDWKAQHLRTVEQAKAHLRGTPTLRGEYDYYREMENNKDVPDRERAQWKVLADGLEHRLGLVGQDVSMFAEEST